MAEMVKISDSNGIPRRQENIDIRGQGEIFFLTFGFKDAL
jgi:hypothetical protein